MKGFWQLSDGGLVGALVNSLASSLKFGLLVASSFQPTAHQATCTATVPSYVLKFRTCCSKLYHILIPDHGSRIEFSVKLVQVAPI
jgi:hypothetical protein